MDLEKLELEVKKTELVKIRKRYFQMTQSEFGKTLGVSKRTIVGYEQGRPMPRYITLALLWLITSSLFK